MNKLFSILVIAFSLILLFGCENKPSNSSQPSSEGTATAANTAVSKEQNNKKDKFDQFIDALKSNNYQIGEKKLMGAEIIGAKEGYKFSVNGTNIEIYQYDLKSTNETTVLNLKTAKETSQISISGIVANVKLNNDMLLAGYDEHPDKDKITKIFTDIKY